MTSLLGSAVRGWNRAVMSMCEYLAAVDGSSVLAMGRRGGEWASQLKNKYAHSASK